MGVASDPPENCTQMLTAGRGFVCLRRRNRDANTLSLNIQRPFQPALGSPIVLEPAEYSLVRGWVDDGESAAACETSHDAGYLYFFNLGSRNSITILKFKLQ
jgi:hypothetical protein